MNLGMKSSSLGIYCELSLVLRSCVCVILDQEQWLLFSKFRRIIQRKNTVKKVDDSAGTLGANIVPRFCFLTANQRNENILKSQWKLEMKTIQLPKMRENMERVTNHRAKLSKSKQKIPGLLSTLNWKIALTSGVGF